jgi:hypothetical protein
VGFTGLPVKANEPKTIASTPAALKQLVKLFFIDFYFY